MYISGPINANPGMRNAHWPGLSHMAKNGVSLTHTENRERLLPLDRARAGCCTREEKRSARLTTRSAHPRRHRSFCAAGIYPSAAFLRWAWWPMESFPQWADWLSYNNNGSSSLLWHSLPAHHTFLLMCLTPACEVVHITIHIL